MTDLSAEYRQLASEQERACQREQEALGRLEELDRRRLDVGGQPSTDYISALNQWRDARGALLAIGRKMRANREAALMAMHERPTFAG